MKINCSTLYLAFAIGNNTLGDGIARNRGLGGLLGGEPQGFRLTTLWTNVAIENAQDCLNFIYSAQNVSACVGRSGGAFYIDRSESWKAASSGSWNGTITDPEEHDGHVLLGWDTLEPQNGTLVTGLPLVVWSDEHPLNRTAIGLGVGSTLLQAFASSKVLPAPPQQVGIYMGSRSESHGVDGEIIFGGYDMARVNGSFTWFPIGNRFPGLDCPLQVLIDDMVLQNSNGSQSLSELYTKVPACLDMIQNAFTLRPIMYQKWANLTHHPSTSIKAFPPYTDQTYPWELESLIGDVVVQISNDQGQQYSSQIPHYEMVSHERGSNA